MHPLESAAFARRTRGAVIADRWDRRRTRGNSGRSKKPATRSRCARPTAFQCEPTRQDACDKARTKMSVMAQVASRLNQLKSAGRDQRAGMDGGDEHGHAETRADKRVGAGAASVEAVGYVEPIDWNLRDTFRSCSRSGRAWSCHRCCCESLAHTIAAAACTRRSTSSAASTARCSCCASRICCNSSPRVWYADSGLLGEGDLCIAKSVGRWHACTPPF